MNGPALRELGRTDYAATWDAMRAFTAARTPDTADAVWLTEHAPVFTLGQAGDPSHVLDSGDIPLVRSDRGGQVTYHGPGQPVLYVLLDLARARFGVRPLVRVLERSVVDLLAEYGVTAAGRTDAPGVYVGNAKIASIGLRVRHGRTYHGVAFNAAMDLAPFARINPCGFRGLAVTDARSLGIRADSATLGRQLAGRFHQHWQEITASALAGD